MLPWCAGYRIAKSPGSGCDQISQERSGVVSHRSDPKRSSGYLFQGLPLSLEVLQWHEDMFNIPEGGVLLAGSEDCPHQAFRYKNSFGLQFHVEVTQEILTDWFSESPDFPSMMARHGQVKEVLSGLRSGCIRIL